MTLKQLMLCLLGIILLSSFLIPNQSKMAEKSSSSDKPHFVLLGDSTIDNLVWVDSYDESIPCKLAKKLMKYCIVNYAADGFTSGDVLNGAYPVISFAQRAKVDPFPTERFVEGIFFPLEATKQLKEEGKDVQLALLSVGGNDVREILGRMEYLGQRVGQFKKNYPAIIENIKKVTPNVILMLQYQPSYKDDAYGVYKALGKLVHDSTLSVPCLNALMEEVYEDIFKLARENNFPVIDLPNTFDIQDASLYKTQIEPSSKGGDIIVDLVSHVATHHDFKGPSVVYSRGKDKVISAKENNQQHWKVGEGDHSTIRAILKQLISNE
jgi:hypothetical protein